MSRKRKWLGKKEKGEWMPKANNNKQNRRKDDCNAI
jgi:hypothetical protein